MIYPAWEYAIKTFFIKFLSKIGLK
jgi:hypothetical protein